MNLFGSDFELWKLHSAADYLNFFAYLAIGVVLFMLAARYLNSQRTETKAARRVVKRLKRLAKRPSRVVGNATLRLPEGDMTFDGMVADKSGIYLMKAFGWGTKIYGAPEGETWRREDTKRKEEFPNPLIELKKGAEQLKTLLEERGVSGIKIMPMVVFADSFQDPELYLGYGSFSTTYQDLKSWYRKQSGVKEPQYDFEKVSSILNEIRVG